MSIRIKFWLFAALPMFGVFVSGAYAFTDVSSGSTYAQAISSLTEQGIIRGYEDGTFRPENSVNRAEFMKIIVGAKTSSPTGSNCFNDVRTEWFARYICYAKQQGIVNGYSDGSFRPASDINLAEALKISLGGNLQVSGQEAWYQPYLDFANNKNYLNNIDRDLAHPISRGETAQLIYNIQNPPAQPVEPTSPSTPSSGQSNEYSWDGSWSPKTSDFPIAGLFDEEYKDLPPGKWDWNDANEDGANYRNFQTSIGTFQALKDASGENYGWKLIGNNPDSIDFSGAAAYFEGSPGTDIINLGPDGQIGSYGSGNLGDGPDVLVFDRSHTLDFRTGSSLSGSKHDNDLVIGGCKLNSGTDFDISTTTIHTGPGSDLVFVRDMERSAIDAGNGDGGNTSVLDPNDGNDAVIYRGNMLDFRFFGGNGDDTAVWYIDEVHQDGGWLGPNFFGGGGSGDALWGDKGTDTLVLVIPPDTNITGVTPTQPGELLVRIPQDYSKDIQWDNPVYDDVNARYCISCGISSGDRKTLTLEYNKKDGTVSTGYFFVTDFEKLQLGVGSQAKVYNLDSVNGTATLNQSLPKYSPLGFPENYCR